MSRFYKNFEKFLEDELKFMEDSGFSHWEFCKYFDIEGIDFVYMANFIQNFAFKNGIEIYNLSFEQKMPDLSIVKLEVTFKEQESLL